MSARIEWVQGSPEAIGAELDQWWNGVERRLDGRLQAVGGEMRTFAQLNHPWVNRTGEAEAELNYDVSRSGDTYILTVYQGAPHGIWLEVRWGGRWGVLPKTITAFYGRVMQAVLEAMG